MKTIKHFFTLFISLNCFSQSFVATYIEKQIINEKSLDNLPEQIREQQKELAKKIHYYYLNYSEGISFYENINEETIEFPTIDNKKYTSGDDKYFYFNYVDSLMFWKTRHYKDYVYIEDKPIDFKWEITKDTLTVNNILCKKAKSNWLGFTTYAWFAESIPINAGPDKFNGLPGLILKVQLPAREFLLTELEKKEKPFEIINPISNQKKISFEEFLDLSNEAIKKLKSGSKYIEGTGVIIREVKVE